MTALDDYVHELEVFKLHRQIDVLKNEIDRLEAYNAALRDMIALNDDMIAFAFDARDAAEAEIQSLKAYIEQIVAGAA